MSSLELFTFLGTVVLMDVETSDHAYEPSEYNWERVLNLVCVSLCVVFHGIAKALSPRHNVRTFRTPPSVGERCQQPGHSYNGETVVVSVCLSVNPRRTHSHTHPSNCACPRRDCSVPLGGHDGESEGDTSRYLSLILTPENREYALPPMRMSDR